MNIPGLTSVNYGAQSAYLQKIRHTTLNGLIIFHLFSACIISALAWISDAPFFLTTASVIILCLIAISAKKIFGISLTGRLTISVTLNGLWMLALYPVSSINGGAHMLEVHMFYFISCLFIIGLCCWRSQIFATLITGIHHTSLTLFAPLIIWAPSETVWLHYLVHIGIAGITCAAGVLIAEGFLRQIDSSDKDMRYAQAKEKEIIEAQRQQKEAEKMQVEVKKRAIAEMASQFESRVAIVVETVEQSASSMYDMAVNLSNNVEKTTNQSNVAALASKESSENFHMVSSSAEKMTSSIHEISQNIAKTASSARVCADMAQTSQDKLEHLQKSVIEIDSVIQSINGVAEQTSLLALNATIEAARAGEAGKGFAVVANEVKTLATETNSMTDEISLKVKGIQNSAHETVESVKNIIEQIKSVDAQTTDVAKAIEEQNSTTVDISKKVHEAAASTNEISDSINEVKSVANESANSTKHLKTASEDLAKQSVALKQAVELFLEEIRSS